MREIVLFSLGILAIMGFGVLMAWFFTFVGRRIDFADTVQALMDFKYKLFLQQKRKRRR